MPSDEPFLDEDSAEEPDPRFPSGMWEGFFVQGGEKFRMTVELHFQRIREARHVCGDGVDAIGPFRMVGTYDPGAGKVRLRKHYVGQHKVAYDGDCGRNRFLQGRWDIRAHQLSGFWRLWPVDGSDDEWELERAEVYTREGPVVFTGWSDFEQHLREVFTHAE